MTHDDIQTSTSRKKTLYSGFEKKCVNVNQGITAENDNFPPKIYFNSVCKKYNFVTHLPRAEKNYKQFKTNHYPTRITNANNRGVKS